MTESNVSAVDQIGSMRLLHGGEPLSLTPALGESDQLATNALSAVLVVGDQHPEFTLAGIQPADLDDANNPLICDCDCDLPDLDQLCDFLWRRAGRAGGPEPVFGDRVHTIHQRRKLVDQRGIRGSVSRYLLDVDQDPNLLGWGRPN
jgi:hypothetical protein